MDIFKIQSLITKGKIVSSADIDPENSYLQIGIYQPGNRKKGASDPNAYPAFAISLLEAWGPIGVTNTSPLATLYSKIPLAKPTSGTSRSIIFGEEAGLNNTATNSIIMGYYAGSNDSVPVNTTTSNFIGHAAGSQSSNCNNSTFVGSNAGQNTHNLSNCVAIGTFAGYSAADNTACNFIGSNVRLLNSTYSTVIGSNAGGFASVNNSIFIGKFTGLGASASSNSIFIGENAGLSSNLSANSIFIGTNAGQNAFEFNNFNSSNSIFLGTNAGYNAYSSNNSVFIGSNAGQNASASSNSIYIGQNAGNNSDVNNVIALGTNAGQNNTRSQSFIISNSSLPAYINRGAAQAAITGGSPGSTYLYYNSTNGVIEGIRFT